MLDWVPWDVRLAAGLAAVIVLAKILAAPTALFIAIYAALGLYVLVETFRSEPS